MMFHMQNSALRRARTLTVVGMVGLLALTGCASGGGGEGGGDGEDVTYKVGALMDLSQTYAFIGEPSLAGLRTAIDEINKSGGVDGAMLELVVKDDRSDAAAGRTAFQELASDGVVAIIGPNASATLTPLAPLAEQYKIPNLSLAAVSDLQGTASPYLYATGLHVAESARIDANWIVEDGGGKGSVVAALSLDTPSVAEFRESLEEAIPAIGGELVANDVVAPDATDMANAVLPIAATNPDYVPVGLLASQLPGVVSSLRDRGSDAKVINYYVASDDATFEAVNDEGFYAVRHYADPTETGNPAIDAMAEAAAEAGQTGGMTNSYFTYGYVTGKLVAHALSECGSGCDGEKLDAALSGITAFDTNGLSGPLGVTADDHFFVKYGKIFGWDGEKTYAVTDWITG